MSKEKTESPKVFNTLKEGVDYMVEKKLAGWFKAYDAVYWCYPDGTYCVTCLGCSFNQLKNVFVNRSI